MASQLGQDDGLETKRQASSPPLPLAPEDVPKGSPCAMGLPCIPATTLSPTTNQTMQCPPATMSLELQQPTPLYFLARPILPWRLAPKSNPNARRTLTPPSSRRAPTPSHAVLQSFPPRRPLSDHDFCFASESIFDAECASEALYNGLLRP